MKEPYLRVHMTEPDGIKKLAGYIVANKENQEVIEDFFDAMQDYFADKMLEMYQRGREDAFKEMKEQRDEDFYDEISKIPRL